DDLAAVYLVGGSSRIPLVTRMLADRMGAVPVTWGDPKAVVVLGAAAAPPEAIGAAPVAPAERPEDDTAVLSGVPLVTAEPDEGVDPTVEAPVDEAVTAPAMPAAASGPG